MDWESIKGFLVGILSRWLFKLLGGVLIGLGYTESSAMELIVGILSFAVGIIISLFQQKKAVNMVPPSSAGAGMAKSK